MDGDSAGVPASRLSSEVTTSVVAGTGGRDIEDLDDLDKKIIVALQIDGRASWRAIAETVGAAVSTVARRGQQLLAEGTVRVGVMPTLGSAGHVESFLIRVNCSPGTQMDVAEELVRSPYVRFVTLVTGRFDLYAEVVITGGSAQQTRVLTSLQSIPGVERWRSDLLTHNYKVSFDWGRQLFDPADLPRGPHSHMPPPNSCEPSHLDESDWRIIGELSVDGRASFPSVATKLGMNESSVRRRYDRLKANGCITTATSVTAASLGMSAETLIILRVAPSHVDAVADALREHLAVRFIAAALDESALYCEVILPTTDDLHRFQTDTLGKLDGVKGWTACMELVFMKRGFVETPHWRDQVMYDQGEMPPSPWLNLAPGSAFN